MAMQVPGCVSTQEIEPQPFNRNKRRLPILIFNRMSVISYFTCIVTHATTCAYRVSFAMELPSDCFVHEADVGTCHGSRRRTCATNVSAVFSGL